jgi:HTH-type transcriptional regulator/antitoxin HigA
MVYKPNKAVHPGHFLARVLEREGMTQKNLSERTGLSEKHLSQIITGNASITVETALLLENALGGSASFWTNLEQNYQESVARIERASALKDELALLPAFPYAELVKRKHVPPTRKKEQRVENLWKFFGINSLTFVPKTEAIAFRKRSGAPVASEAIATWLRCGELASKDQSLPAYSEAALRDALPRLKALSRSSAAEFSVQAREVLEEAGVSLVYVQHFPGTGVSGSVRWIGNNPVIQLSLLGAYADMFWFNLFHEIAHLLLHGKKEKFIEFTDRDISEGAEKEREADRFASDELIDRKEYAAFIQAADFTPAAITRFAERLGINPGIVAGRLCHEHHVQWQDVVRLRTRLKFVQGE